MIGVVGIERCSSDAIDLVILRFSFVGVRFRSESKERRCLRVVGVRGVLALNSICGISVLIDDVVEGDSNNDRVKDLFISFPLIIGVGKSWEIVDTGREV